MDPRRGGMMGHISLFDQNEVLQVTFFIEDIQVIAGVTEIVSVVTNKIHYSVNQSKT